MLFTSSLVLALGLFTNASPILSEVDVTGWDAVPNASVLPLTVFATDSGLDPIVAAEGLAGSTGSVAPLLTELTDALNTTTTSLSTRKSLRSSQASWMLVFNHFCFSCILGREHRSQQAGPQTRPRRLLTPVDGALTGLGGVFPPVLTLVGGLLVPVGGIVGGLLSGLGLATL
ncbi:hypothetical protein B0H17DRAFT_1216229 [Mycena rosella]|uniref:Uncharacterized protein n=1 Tax=Mycena rosella TaxID=1033263 RepID=A0AAD7C9M3_MYCRO|nr:hypothetical protein B0H17DRAFT_1216229 [Mycena rosella]